MKQLHGGKNKPELVAQPRERAPTRASGGNVATLAIGALGIVFGDIGTSPLYAIDQIFFGTAEIGRTPENILGAISLAIWTITVVVAIKYALLVLRADNDGEGGVFALYGLLHRFKGEGRRVLLWSLMLGAGLLLGDGMITPAISVLSAVEGLEVATPAFSPYIVPITVVLLTALFSIQFKGTAGIGGVFGPLLLVWFVVIAALGLVAIARQPGILAAFDPSHGIGFLMRAGPLGSLLILSAMMLVITGGEAMYADLGHFGVRPIRISWFAVVFPSLLLNYLGQGAYLMGGSPVEGGKLFYNLVPQPLLVPLVVLATLATIVASQALISAAFSLISQAVGLGLFPRLNVRHTHQAHSGQIYIPVINWALYVGCVTLVVAFRSSAELAAAYGLAVAGVMVITSAAMYAVARRYWHWSPTQAALVWGALIIVNGALLAASTLKFLEGGFIPLGIGVISFLVMATWRWGRKATFAAYAARSTMTIADVVELHRAGVNFIERNALVLAPTQVQHLTDRAPTLVSLLWDRYGILPRNLIIVEVIHPKVPYVHDDRYRVMVFDRDQERGCVISVQLRFGFMEEPNVERYLEDMARHHEIDLPAHPRQWVVHVSHENLLPARDMGPLRRLRFRLFLLLRLISRPTYYGYHLGERVQLSAEIMPVRVR
jgi:KUP system potassium uptake protein